MDYETIPLSRLEATLRTTLDECVRSGRPIIVELPGDRRVAVQPLPASADDGEHDHFMDDLIASNAEFRARVARSTSSGTVPFDLTPEPE